MLIIAYIIFIFLLLRTGVSVYNLFSAPYLRKAEYLNPNSPLVSILIPARNEENNLPGLLESVCRQKYKNYEVLILDDNSEDNTCEVAISFAAKHKNINVIKGEKLPAGWVGKNFACHQLSLRAKGELFLFADADVRLQPDALGAAVAELKSKNLKLLSLFPDQEMKTWGEKIVVPVMHYLLLSLLPLRLVYKSKNPAFAAANGQFMLFDADTYRKYNFHRKLCNTVIEDIAIIRFMKRENLAVETLLGNTLVKCRMYASFKDAVEGFSKNLSAGFGNNIFIMSAYFFLVFWGYIFIFWFMPWQMILMAFILMILIRVSIAVNAKQNILEQLILYPLQMCMLLLLAYISFYRKTKKQITWKGRTLEV